MQLFTRNESGAIAITFAVGLTVLFGVVGLAIDIGRVTNARTTAQNSLDAAVLAAMSEETEESSQNAFNSFLASKGLDPTKATISWNVESSQIIGTSTYSTRIPTSFARIFGFSDLPVEVAAAAVVRTPETVSELKFNLKEAYGWYDKNVAFYALRPDGRTEVIAHIDYKMTDHKAANWRGTGVMTVSPSTTVSVGPFKTIWAVMTVKSATNVTQYRTDDPTTSEHLFINGVQMPHGKTVDIGTLLPCGNTVEYAWEDSTGVVAFAAQDIFFDIQVACNANSRGRIHLVK